MLPQCKDTHGQALIEILLAMAIFALIAVGLLSALTSGFSGDQQGNEYGQALAFAQDGMEVARNIRDRAWNEILFSESGVTATSGAWVFTGEGTSDRQGQFVRNIAFDDVCRDAQGNIADCPGVSRDIHSKRARVAVSWPRQNGTSSIEIASYLTNWDSRNWTQSDWSLGSGQAIWLNPQRYRSDDDHLQVKVGGQLALARNDYCRVREWTFDRPEDYVFDPTKVEVAGEEAHLLNQGDSISGISQPRADEWEFEANIGREPNVVQVGPKMFAVAYRGPGDDGIVTTFVVNAEGQITKQRVDQLTFDAASVIYLDIMHVTDDIYAISYRASTKKGTIKTVRISEDGAIGNAVLDTLVFDGSAVAWSDMTFIRGNIYGVAYQGPNNHGYIKTFTIAANGLISDQVIDVVKFDTVMGYNPRVVRRSDDILAVAYRGPDNDGFLATVGVNAAGQLSDAVLSRYEFDPVNTLETAIIHISESIVAVAYRGVGDDGFVVTIAIQANGTIIPNRVDMLEFDPRNGIYPDIQHVAGNTYGALTRSSGNDGYLTLFRIDQGGVIDNAIIATAEFSADKDVAYPKLLSLSEDRLLAVYQGSNNHGYVATMGLSINPQYPSDNPTIEPSVSFQVEHIGQWALFEQTATTDVKAQINYQLSDDNGATWYYWNGANWAQAGANDRSSADVINTWISYFPTSTGMISFRAFLQSDGRAQAHLDTLRIGCTNKQYEIGSIVADEQWVTVPLQHDYQAPVVIASYREQANGTSMSPRIRKITSSTFDIRLQQTQDQDIGAETLSYFVIEKGVWNIDGVVLEAGYVDTNKTGSSAKGWKQFEKVNFRAPFVQPPAVFHQVMSSNDERWVTTFVRSVAAATSPPDQVSMGIALNASKSLANDHAKERVGWIAVNKNVSTTFHNTPFETRTTPDGARGVKGHQEGCFTFGYSQRFAAPPIAFASQQEMDGSHGSWTAICSHTPQKIGLHAEEYDNGERSHTDETTAFMAFEQAIDDTVVQEDDNPVALHGDLTSSAFSLAHKGSIQEIEWDEHIPECQPACMVRLQVRAAKDVGGAPQQWTPWYGADGPNTFFTTSTGSLIPTALNGYQWMQYRVEFDGDGQETPVVQEVRINYK